MVGRGVGAGSGNPATTRQSLYNESLGGGRAIKVRSVVVVVRNARAGA
jgi:hypothetical protein